jgi:hypothetical protein
VKFQGLARGFPWAWDEEVAAGVAHLPAHHGARLAAACPVAADALAEAALRRGVRRAVGPERELSGALDAKVVVAQDAARWEQQELKARQAVPPQVPQAQPSQPALAQRVSLREPGLLQARESLLPEVMLQARVSPPQVPAHVAPRVSPLVLGLLASPPPVGAPARPEEQQAPLPGPLAAVTLPLPPLLSPCARLPPRFPRPPLPLDVA